MSRDEAAYDVLIHHYFFWTTPPSRIATKSAFRETIV